MNMNVHTSYLNMIKFLASGDNEILTGRFFEEKIGLK